MSTDSDMRAAARAGIFPNGIVGRTVKVQFAAGDAEAIAYIGATEATGQVLALYTSGSDNASCLMLLLPDGLIVPMRPWAPGGPAARVYLVS